MRPDIEDAVQPSSGMLAGVLATWLERLVGLEGLAGASDIGPGGGAGSGVVVACSGGADSLALLALACAGRLAPVAVYVDHGLRAAAESDFAVVVAAAERLGARRAVRIGVASPIEGGSNLEARARAARYRSLEAVRSDSGAATILVGHTGDDQAETLLLNLLRGSGSPGLAAMAVRRDRVVRPMLRLRRSDTREICALLGLAPVEDAMNSETRFRRVWLRREVMPRLESGAGRDISGVLNRQAALLREESDYLDALGAAALAESGEPPSSDVLGALPAPVARRAVRLWLGDPPVSSEHVDEVLEIVAGRRRAAQLPGGRRVERAAGLMRVSEAEVSRPSPVDAASVPLPGRAEAAGIVIESWVESAAPVAWPDGRWACVVDADAAGEQALLRGPVPGERIRPLGLGGSKLVADALAESGVAASARSRSSVLAAGEGAAVPEGEPLWVVGYRIDDRVRVTTRTRRFLWLTAGSFEQA